MTRQSHFTELLTYLPVVSYTEPGERVQVSPVVVFTHELKIRPSEHNVKKFRYVLYDSTWFVHVEFQLKFRFRFRLDYQLIVRTLHLHVPSLRF